MIDPVGMGMRTHLRGGVMVKDPVCGMMIDEKTAAGQSEFNGTTYHFCAPICKQKFDQDPNAYLTKDR